MPDTENTQTTKNIFSRPGSGAKPGETHGGVWQDKSGSRSDRTASVQPASVGDPRRSEHQRSRSQPQPKPKPAAVPLQLWVSPAVKAEIQRLATAQGLSSSAVGAALLEEILRQKLHAQQGATLEAVIEQCIVRTQRTLATRLAAFLARIAFDTGQTRVLTVNLLGQQEGMSEESLKEILATADKRTKANLTRRTPQLTELMDAVEQWLLSREEDAGEGRQA